VRGTGARSLPPQARLAALALSLDRGAPHGVRVPERLAPHRRRAAIATWQAAARQVKGKVNAITVDQCARTGVVFDDLVAVCELVNSTALQVQVTGRVPTIAVDKCDGVQVRRPGAPQSRPPRRAHPLLCCAGLWAPRGARSACKYAGGALLGALTSRHARDREGCSASGAGVGRCVVHAGEIMRMHAR